VATGGKSTAKADRPSERGADDQAHRGTGTATPQLGQEFRRLAPARRPARHPFPVLSGSWPAADEAVFDIRPAQHLDSMPIAGLDERDTALEIEGTEPGDGRVQQQVNLVVGQRCALMADP